MSEQDRERYNRAAHAMQTGVAFLIGNDAEPWPPVAKEINPKHLRVGINVALRDMASLVKLLIDKGFITLDEYEKALADGMEEEVKIHEEILKSKNPGTNFHLH